MAQVSKKQAAINAPLPVVQAALQGENITPIRKRGRPAKAGGTVQAVFPTMEPDRIYYLNPSLLTLNPENPRSFNPGVSNSDRDFLAMIEGGGGRINTAIEVVPVGEALIVEVGNRRKAALDNMMARGLEVPLVPVKLFRTTDEVERAYDRQTSNTGKPLNMLEQGNLYQTLHAKHGQTDEAIGLRIGKSGRYVALCRELANTSPNVVKDWIQSETIAATLASDLMRGQVIKDLKGWDAAVDLIARAVEHASDNQTKKQAADGVPVRVTKESLLAVSKAPAKERTKRETKQAEPTPEQVAAKAEAERVKGLRDTAGETAKLAQIAKTRLDIAKSQEATLAKAVENAPDAKARKESLKVLKLKAAERAKAEAEALKAEAAKVAAKAEAEAAKVALEQAAKAAKDKAAADKAKADSQRDPTGPSGAATPDNSKPLLVLYRANGPCVVNKSGTEIARASSKEIAGMIALALNYHHTHAASDL